jgi:hypothetical protein
MNIAVFHKLCRKFHQDLALIALSDDDFIRQVFEPLSASEKADLRIVLDELLDKNFDGRQLLALWDQSPADFVFKSPDDLRRVLDHIRRQIK